MTEAKSHDASMGTSAPSFDMDQLGDALSIVRVLEGIDFEPGQEDDAVACACALIAFRRSTPKIPLHLNDRLSGTILDRLLSDGRVSVEEVPGLLDRASKVLSSSLAAASRRQAGPGAPE